MSKKTMKKVIVAVLTILMVVVALTQMSYAAGFFSPEEIEPKAPAQSDDIKNLGGKILGALQTVGVVLAVIIMAVLGIKYMMGSAEEKADYKKSFIPYIVGAVILFLAPTIVNIIYNFVQPS